MSQVKEGRRFNSSIPNNEEIQPVAIFFRKMSDTAYSKRIANIRDVTATWTLAFNGRVVSECRNELTDDQTIIFDQLM